MRKALYAVLVSGLFLLLLSALVVTPEAPEMPSEPLPANLQAVFRPLVSAVLPEAASVPAQPHVSVSLAALPVLMTGLLLPSGVRDANGRILTAIRYENSVYQLFRPEVAGG